VATAQPQTQSAREVVTEYFDALAAQDLDRAAATWKPGSIDRLHGVADLVAPDGIRNYFASLFAAVPDFRFEVLDMVAEGDQVAVRWRTGGVFSGTGDVLGFAPNGRPIELEGLDLLTVEDGKIVSNFAYVNGMVFAQQIGALPDPESRQGRAMAAAFNAKTAIAKRLRG
jgi:predicted ester cyclase